MTTITISSDILDNPLLSGPFDRLRAFLWLVVNSVEGQIKRSVRELSEAWGWSKSSVQRFLSELERGTLIETTPGTVKQTITICKHTEFFQKEEEPGTVHGTVHGTDDQAHYIVPARTDAPAQGINTLFLEPIELQSTKYDTSCAPASPEPKSNVVSMTPAKSKGSAGRGSRLPEDWTMPPDWGNWAMSKGMKKAQIVKEAEKFKNFWLAKSGKDAAKIRWDLTWQNWIINAMERQEKFNGKPEKRDVGMQVFEHFCGNPFDGMLYPADEFAAASDYERPIPSGLF